MLLIGIKPRAETIVLEVTRIYLVMSGLSGHTSGLWVVEATAIITSYRPLCAIDVFIVAPVSRHGVRISCYMASLVHYG